MALDVIHRASAGAVESQRQVRLGISSRFITAIGICDSPVNDRQCSAGSITAFGRIVKFAAMQSREVLGILAGE